MTQWILIIWAVGAFIVLRWGSVPAMVQMHKRDVQKYHEYSIPLLLYLIIAALIALCWPTLVLYKLIWPRGIDAKAKREARLKQEAEEEAARIKEAERVLREFDLHNPTE